MSDNEHTEAPPTQWFPRDEPKGEGKGMCWVLSTHYPSALIPASYYSLPLSIPSASLSSHVMPSYDPARPNGNLSFCPDRLNVPQGLELKGFLPLLIALHQTQLLKYAPCPPHTGPTIYEWVNNSRTNPNISLHPTTTLHCLPFSISSSFKPSFYVQLSAVSENTNHDFKDLNRC